MTAHRLSRLQRRILAWLEAEVVRSKGSRSPGHQDLVRALAGVHRQSISRSLKSLEARRLVVVGRTPWGEAEYVNLVRQG